MALKKLMIAMVFTSMPLAAYAAPQMQAGQWSMETVIQDIVMPGMSPQALAMMKQPRSTRVCISPEQAKDGPKNLLTEKNYETCSFTRYHFGGGEIDAVMKCKRSEAEMTSTTKGRYTGDTYAATTSIVTHHGNSKMTMTTQMKGKRIGACPSK